jgi:hypothetical protein
MSSPIEISARMSRWFGIGARGEETSAQHAFLTALMAIMLVSAVTAAGHSLYGAYGPHALESASLSDED